MVVEEDNRRSTYRDCFAEYLARMGDRRVERSGRNDFDLQLQVLGVEHDDAELLNRPRTVFGQRIRRELSRRIQLRPTCVGPDQRPASELDGRQHLRSARTADTGDV